MADPWLKFYTTDWRSDPRLRMCSVAARGLWIEMICLMHEAEPYGHLLVSGKAPSTAQLAVLVGAAVEEVAACLEELRAAGVFSTTKGRVIYSRKLERMANRARKSRENGKKGGNPTLCSETEKTDQVNLPDKGRLKTQNPEARIQKYSVPYGTDAGGVDAAPSAADEVEEFDPAKILFQSGVAFLVRHGIAESSARSVIGRWRKDFPDPLLIEAISACRREGVVDPVPWINRHLAARHGAQGRDTRSRDQSDLLKQWATSPESEEQ